MHAAVGAVGVGEIALLHRQATEVFPRHRAHLAQLAHEKVGQGLLRLGVRVGVGMRLLLRRGMWLRGRMWLRRRMWLHRRVRLNLRMGLRMDLRRKRRLSLHRMLCLSMRLVLRLNMWLVLRLRLHWLHFRPGSDIRQPTMLKFHECGYGLKLGLQVFDPAIVLPLKLLDQFLELSLRRVDLLLKQVGSVL
jgi:hypothetical protein